MTEETTLVAYELMAILDPSLGEDGSLKQIDTIKKHIETLGGKITHEDLWGIRDLAYRIRKEERGYYVVLNIEIDGRKLLELTKDLKLEQNILRILTIKIPKNYQRNTLKYLDEEAARYKKEREEAREAKGDSRPTAKKPEAKKEASSKVVASTGHVPRKVEPKPVVEPVAEKVEEKEVEETPEVKPEPVAEPVAEKVEEKEVEKTPEVKPEPVAEPEEKIELSDASALDDVDAKLKSIIDDPDISL